MAELKEYYETKDGDRYERKEASNGKEYFVRKGQGRISKWAYHGGKSRLSGSVSEPDTGGPAGLPPKTDPSDVTIVDVHGEIAVGDGNGGYEWIEAENVEIQNAAKQVALTQTGAAEQPNETVEIGGKRYDTERVAAGIERADADGEPIAHYNS